VGAAFPTGETVVSFQCAGGWAAGSKTNGNYDSAFLLRSVNGTWSVAPASDCTNAAALGIPTAILNISSCKVS
jgi:hypothetical protein